MINLQQIPTSGAEALCGYFSMANYIATLPFNLRKKFYIKLFSTITKCDDYNSLDDNVFLLLEQLVNKDKFNEGEFNQLKYQQNYQSITINFEQLQIFFPKIFTDSKDLQHFIGYALAEVGKKIVHQSAQQLQTGQGSASVVLEGEAIATASQAGAGSFIIAENLKKTYRFFFPNQDLAMLQEVSNPSLKHNQAQARQGITTETTIHANSRLSSLKKIVDEECKKLVPIKSDPIRLDEFSKKTDKERQQIYFYLSLKIILEKLSVKEGLQHKTGMFNCPLTYQRYASFFSHEKFTDDEIVKNVLREIFNLKTLNQELESRAILYLTKNSYELQLKIPHLKNSILENLQQQFSLFSFRYKFLSSNPFCVSNFSGAHYTTAVDRQRLHELNSSVFLEYDSSALIASEDQDQISQKMIADIFAKANDSVDKQLAPHQTHQPANQGEANKPQLNKLYRSSEIFLRLNGRKDDIIRYAEGKKEVEVEIDKILTEVAGKYTLTYDDLVLAMAIAKRFGGIGSALPKIRAEIDKFAQPLSQADGDQSGSDPSSQLTQGFYRDCLTLFADRNKLKNICQFSAEFQETCRQNKIYSGREELTDQQAQNYGCRLAFIPDEIFAFHFNALPYSSTVKQNIDKFIANHQKQKIVEVKKEDSLVRSTHHPSSPSVKGASIFIKKGNDPQIL